MALQMLLEVFQMRDKTAQELIDEVETYNKFIKDFKIRQENEDKEISERRRFNNGKQSK